MRHPVLKKVGIKFTNKCRPLSIVCLWTNSHRACYLMVRQAINLHGLNVIKKNIYMWGRGPIMSTISRNGTHLNGVEVWMEMVWWLFYLYRWPVGIKKNVITEIKNVGHKYWGGVGQGTTAPFYHYVKKHFHLHSWENSWMHTDYKGVGTKHVQHL
jgi:hypothetical protein